MPPVGIYGHYDVQPISRDETRDSDPFVLTLSNGRLYARGAQDNKGQFWYSVQARKHLKLNGLLYRDVYIFV